MNSYGQPTPPTPTFPPQKKKNRSLWIALGAVALVVVLIVALVIAILASVFGQDGGLSVGDRYVGVLHIEGTIASTESTGLLYSDGSLYSQSYLLTSIEQMKADGDNVGILLYIDTPGGEIYATDELYLALEQYKEETARPIYAYFASMACSGGYYAAMAADEIYANRMTTTGSIGVSYGTHIDVSGLCERLGIKVEDIVSGDNKAMGSYFAPLTDEQREIYISQLDEYYGYFVDVVVKGRGMTADEVRALADGRTYTAKQALQNGLIDGIAGYDEYCARILSAYSDEVILYDFEYVAEGYDLTDLYAGTLSEIASASELNALLATLKPLSGILVYYSGS